MRKNQLSKVEQSLFALNKISKEYRHHPNLISVKIWREEEEYGVILFVSKYSQDLPSEYLGLEVIQRIVEV